MIYLARTRTSEIKEKKKKNSVVWTGSPWERKAENCTELEGLGEKKEAMVVQWFLSLDRTWFCYLSVTLSSRVTYRVFCCVS